MQRAEQYRDRSGYSKMPMPCTLSAGAAPARLDLIPMLDRSLRSRSPPAREGMEKTHDRTPEEGAEETGERSGQAQEFSQP
jgi:hypothetical protein